jgi:hypothetical protein
MRWLWRFLGWATVLAAPSWLIGDAYHHGLAKLSLWMLRIPADRMAFEPPDIPASHALGVFGALCLASVRTPLARRLVALAVGVAGLATLELFTGVMAIRWSLEAAAAGGASAPAQRLLGHLTGLPAWIGAPVLWLLLLGGRELPRAPRPGRARSEPAPRA